MPPAPHVPDATFPASVPDSVERATAAPVDSSIQQIVLVFCRDLTKDPVSAHVLEQVLATGRFEPTTTVFDDMPVLTYRHAATHYHLVQLNDVLSHHYARYAATINTHFANADAIILVNWHQGAKAPNAIFTVQTTGDMASGHFSPADPAICRRLFLAVEAERQQAGLDTFSTWMEATHWSGAERDAPLIDLRAEAGGDAKAHVGDGVTSVPTSQPDAPLRTEPVASPPANVNDLRASVIDLEIGSSPDDWANPVAAAVLARALFRLAAPPITQRLPLLPILCIGGTHFEPGFTQLLRDHGAAQGLALSHILPNHWLVAHGYDQAERDDALAACAASIVGGVRAVVFHDNLKGSFKARARHLADALGVPALSHKKLRTPDIAKAIRDAANAP